MDRCKPAKASNYFHHFKLYRKVHSNLELIGYGRVSESPQFYNCNIDTYENRLRRICKKKNIPFLKFFGELCSGKPSYFQKRKALLAAIAYAKKLRKQGKNVAILAPSTDRFLRNQNYTMINQSSLPIEADFKAFMELTEGIPILTLLHPDMSWRKVRGWHSKWAQKFKGNKGGWHKHKRPGYKKQMRIEKLPLAKLLDEKNYSLGRIARIVGSAKSTVADWKKKYF